MYMHEKAGITFVDIKGGLSVKELANAITKTQEDKQVIFHFIYTFCINSAKDFLLTVNVCMLG